jgi:peptidyl-prolyl cis-trans isomerase SurA
LILKNKRKIKEEINFKKELDKAIINERNKQLNQFSSIYFKKVELNTVINEK